eukprot:CAMPEP_0179491056 /NCGR_PEP_ID=MMETSP0799-20121207/65848_1 /TAXON_ID=46947 /ORGANISM="Geminigera cryophila, Strain CCMP2564" /LENGTH=771 /DNA_ID=CAMNT_0021307409 /DNA_START=451 /DNA_END=2766 /DNA_ORIENTATION=-
MEVARDLRECWVLKVFWASSAVAGTVALPTVILSAQTNGYGLAFYVYLLHNLLYYGMAFLVFRYPHESREEVPELVGFGAADNEEIGVDGKLLKNSAQGFLTTLWRDRFMRLLAMFSPEKLYLAGAFLCMCGGVAMNGLGLVVVGRLFNNFYYPYSPDSARGYMREYCMVLMCVYMLSSTLNAAQATLVQLVGERMASRTRRKLFHNILRQETSFFDGCDPAHLVKVLQIDVALIQRTMGDHIFHGLHCVLNFMVAVSIMFVVSWKMALVVLSLSPVCLLVIRIQSFYAKKLSKERGSTMGATTLLVRETLENLRVVRALAAEARQVDQYKDLAADVYDLSLQTGMVNATSKSSATLVVQLAVALSLYVAGMAVLTRQVEVGYIITFAGVSILAMSSIAQFAPLVRQMTKALRATEEVLNLLDRTPEGAAMGGTDARKSGGGIELRDVVFDYPVPYKQPDEAEGGAATGPLLNNLSLTILPGSMTAIVGARHSGKTAVEELIQRLYDPLHGTVLLDGQDVRTLDSDWLRENVVVVHQEPILLAMSIAQNIAYSLDSVTQAQVEAAARFANAHEFIQTIPDGYQALVGDTGVRLTGPQRLQVGLARAVLSPGKILILDETLSGLDEQSAGVVLDNLRREFAGAGKTIIALTAFPQSLRGAFDTVAMLHAGKISAQGTHQDLVSRSPEYGALVDPSTSPDPNGWVSMSSLGQESTLSSVENEAMWKKRLSIADQLEDSILQLGVPQGKLMDLVEMVTEIKEALALEASSSALR